jgi:hypothetical protein
VLAIDGVGRTEEIHHVDTSIRSIEVGGRVEREMALHREDARQEPLALMMEEARQA